MPNWCSNKLTISGDEAELEHFWMEVSKGDEIDLTVLYPTPEGLRGDIIYVPSDSPEYEAIEAARAAKIAEYGYADWYEWSVANWGTKWPPSFRVFGDPNEDGPITLIGDSAWSPPERLILKISEMYPGLEFVLAYSEGGMDFVGAMVIRNGSVVGESDGTISTHVDYENENWDEEYNEIVDELLLAHEENAKRLAAI